VGRSSAVSPRCIRGDIFALSTAEKAVRGILLDYIPRIDTFF
jgi:hypothetical protein